MTPQAYLQFNKEYADGGSHACSPFQGVDHRYNLVRRSSLNFYIHRLLEEKTLESS